MLILFFNAKVLNFFRKYIIGYALFNNIYFVKIKELKLILSLTLLQFRLVILVKARVRLALYYLR